MKAAGSELIKYAEELRKARQDLKTAGTVEQKKDLLRKIKSIGDKLESLK